jgi:hypothetical protein
VRAGPVTPASYRRDRLSALAPVLVLALMAAYVVPFAWANLIPDGIRDLQASLAIARGERFERAGPLINFAFHLGPLWLYLQAVPLLLVQTFTAAGLWIGFLGSLKFPFAYATGCALHGRPLGLMMALAVALPSVAAYQWMFAFHPTLVEPFVWAGLWLAARCWMRPSLAVLYGATLAVGIAIQFHPTAAFYAPLPWLILLARRREFGRWPLHAVALLLPLLAGFLPLLAPGTPNGALGMLAATGGPAPPAAPALKALRDVPTLFAALLWNIPAFVVADTLLPGLPAASGLTVARALLGAIYAVAVWGALRAGRLDMRVRVAFALALLWLLAGISIASLMREVVGFYTLFFLLPLAGFAIGVGLFAAGLRARGGDGLLHGRGPDDMSRAHAAIAGGLFALAVAMSWQTVREAREGLLDVYLGGLADPRRLNHDRVRVGRYSMHSRDRAGPWLCGELAARRPVVLHGELAFDEASSFGVDLRMHCPAILDARRLPLLLGREPAGDAGAAGEAPVHWMALSTASWQELGRAPDFWLGELGVRQPVRLLHPAKASPLDVRWRYYEAVLDRQPVQTFRYDVPAGLAPHVLVTRLQPWATTHEVAVTCEGRAVPPVVTTLTAQVYALPDRRCEIALTTDVPDKVGIAAF